MKFFLSVRKSIFIPLNLNDCKLTCAGPNQVTPSKTELAFEIPLTIALDLGTSTASSDGIRSRNSTNQNAPHNRPGAAKLGTQNPVKKKNTDATTVQKPIANRSTAPSMSPGQYHRSPSAHLTSLTIRMSIPPTESFQ